MTDKNQILRDNAEDIRKRLIELAKNKDTISYGKLVEEYGITLPEDHKQIIEVLESILCDISSSEYEQGRHLLSVLVVYGRSGLPGGGFYELASQLGKFTEGGKRAFFRQERDRVFDAWAQNQNAPSR